MTRAGARTGNEPQGVRERRWLSARIASSEAQGMGTPTRWATKTGATGCSTRGALARAHQLLRAFSDPTRLRILHLLLGGEVCVGDLESVLRLPQSTTSRHLAYLRRSRLVSARHAGHWVFYALARPTGELHETLLSCLSTRLGGAPELEQDLRRLARKRARNTCCQTGIVSAGPASDRVDVP
jgi:ArsR family transcriptional regulator